MQVEVNSYQDIGDYLREVRESLGLDVRDIGQRLNIRAKYLTAIEAGNIDELPGKIYARGYVQNYAEFLGLDKEELAEAFDRLNNGGGKVQYFVPEPTERNYQPGMLVVGVALVVVMTVYYYWYTHYHTAEPADYSRVSPVPERLLDSIVGDTVVQENDVLFTPPYYQQTEGLQGDNSVTPEGEAVPEAAAQPVAEIAPPADLPAEAPAAIPPEQQTDAPAGELPAPEMPASVPAAMPEATAEPAAPTSAGRPLPWLKEE